jgi:hypothetical protein
MKWRKGRRRGVRIGRRMGGVRMGRAGGVGGIGGGLALVVIVVLALVFGIDPAALLQGTPQGQGPSYETEASLPSAAQNELADFVSVVLADTEDTWAVKFKQMNGRYQEPTLVLFTGAVDSACGFADAAVGPFYCPGDRKVYLDLYFFNELRQRFGAPGDFAQAYVVAHEIGHHVQALLGIEEQVRALQSQVSQRDANALSVMMELQADCLAGIWANNASKRGLLEVGDVEEALNAASAIGDDRIQQQTTGYVAPDSFTHGSSAQRVAWFRRGLDTGSLESCDTFSADQL